MKNSVTAILLITLFWSCSSRRGTGDPLPTVTVSIAPLQYFVTELAGDMVHVNTMVPDGASPATYEPTVMQLKQLESSSLYLGIGHLGFELGWMQRIRSVNPEMKVRQLDSGLDLITGNDEHMDDHGHDGDHDHSGTDPHVWMSVNNARAMTVSICEELCRILPEHETRIRENLTGLQAELDFLDARITELLVGSGHGSFMIYHPALAYFARDYNLVQIPLEYGGKEPSPSYMRAMTDRGRELGINTILIQRQFDRRNAEVLAAELDARVVVIDPLAADWARQMIHIAESLRQTW